MITILAPSVRTLLCATAAFAIASVAIAQAPAPEASTPSIKLPPVAAKFSSAAIQSSSSLQKVVQPKPATHQVVRRLITSGSPTATPQPSALVAVRDAETGQLRAPTAEERSSMQLLGEAHSRSDVGLEETHYDDGTVGVRLGGRFQSALVLNHEHGTTCSTDAHHITKLVHAAKPAEAQPNLGGGSGPEAVTPKTKKAVQ